MMNIRNLEMKLAELEDKEWRIFVMTDFLTERDWQEIRKIRTEKKEIKEQLEAYK